MEFKLREILQEIVNKKKYEREVKETSLKKGQIRTLLNSECVLKNNRYCLFKETIKRRKIKEWYLVEVYGFLFLKIGEICLYLLAGEKMILEKKQKNKLVSFECPLDYGGIPGICIQRRGDNGGWQGEARSRKH